MTKLEVTRPGCPSPVECRGCQRRARCTGRGAHAGGTGQRPTHSAQRHTHTTPPSHKEHAATANHTRVGACAPHSHTQTKGRPLEAHATGPRQGASTQGLQYRRAPQEGRQVGPTGCVVPCSRPPTQPHLQGAWAWVAANPVVVWSVPLHTSQPPVLAAQGKQPPDHAALPLPARRPAALNKLWRCCCCSSWLLV